jgi:hypothetical protein
MLKQTQTPPARPKRLRGVSAVVAGICVLGTVALLGVCFQRSPRQDAALFRRAYTLPVPEPIQSPALPLPAVTVTLPPSAPQVAPRPSLWEIRAELKRGLGEWEFPHYVNAPHYGSGPDSPLPSQPNPHVASAWAE